MQTTILLLSNAGAYLIQFGGFGILALRAVIGAIFLVHAKPKFGSWKPQAEGQANPMAGAMRFLSIVETLGALSVLTGFLTQFAAIGLGLVMLGAIYFKVFKWKSGFMSHTGTGWELDLIVLAGCIALATLGGGRWTLDSLLLIPA